MAVLVVVAVVILSVILAVVRPELLAVVLVVFVAVREIIVFFNKGRLSSDRNARGLFR